MKQFYTIQDGKVKMKQFYTIQVGKVKSTV